jgi:hypothetical protein
VSLKEFPSHDGLDAYFTLALRERIGGIVSKVFCKKFRSGNCRLQIAESGRAKRARGKGKLWKSRARKWFRRRIKLRTQQGDSEIYVTEHDHYR